MFYVFKMLVFFSMGYIKTWNCSLYLFKAVKDSLVIWFLCATCSCLEKVERAMNLSKNCHRSTLVYGQYVNSPRMCFAHWCPKWLAWFVLMDPSYCSFFACSFWVAGSLVVCCVKHISSSLPISVAAFVLRITRLLHRDTGEAQWPFVDKRKEYQPLKSMVGQWYIKAQGKMWPQITLGCHRWASCDDYNATPHGIPRATMQTPNT